MTDRTLTALEGARKLLERRQAWTQGTFFSGPPGNRCMCLSGALSMGCHPGEAIDLQPIDGTYANALSWIAKAIRELGFTTKSATAIADEVFVIRFNDSPTRRHQDILAVLDRAISLKREAA